MSDDPVLPSLLSREATGGDIAESGFSFQEAVLLAKLPRWLAMDGFSSCIREAVCDFEASFFVAGAGVRLEGVEAKLERQTPAKFWKEIETFQAVVSGSGKSYAGFTLACTELGEDLQPMLSGLRRVRDPYPFYDRGVGILESSYADYESKVLALGKDSATARFMFDCVLVEPTWATAQRDAEALFIGAMQQHLPWSAECTAAALSSTFGRMKALLQSRKAKPVLRHELDEILRSAAPTTRPTESITLHTLSTGTEKPRPGPISVSWERYFPDDPAGFPSADDWDRDVVGGLENVHAWVTANRRPKLVRITGDRRLSASLAVGAVLSAVAGYTLEIEYRGSIWSTATHPNSSTPPYGFKESLTGGQGSRLTVVLSLLRDISHDVGAYAAKVGLSGNPILQLLGEYPIEDPSQANLAARVAKEAIIRALAATGAREIDFFFAGPTPLAVFLAHRLNATAPIRCYGRTSTDGYRPTCQLFAPTAAPQS